MFIKVHFKI